MKRLVCTIYLILILVSACTPEDTGDWRFPCRSDLECPQNPITLSCLPLYQGETLQDYCEKASCPSIEGFEAFATLHTMPKVCDQDRNQDGLADAIHLLNLTPLKSQEVGRLPDECNTCTSVEKCNQVQCAPLAGSLGIVDLFNSSCNESLLYLDELRMCIPYPVSDSFCSSHSDCTSTDYCSPSTFQCEPQLELMEKCTDSSMCLSQNCIRNQCVQGFAGDPCTLDDECSMNLVCTGQRTASPNHEATFGPKVCSDASRLLSACDPSIVPCSDPLICSDQVECDQYDQPNQMVCQTQTLRTRFVCINP